MTISIVVPKRYTKEKIELFFYNLKRSITNRYEVLKKDEMGINIGANAKHLSNFFLKKKGENYQIYSVNPDKVSIHRLGEHLKLHQSGITFPKNEIITFARNIHYYF